MNIAYLLMPKSKVAFISDTCTLRQGLEKMKYHGYTAIPVISKDNKYIGTVSEGDFLWYLVGKDERIRKIGITDIESIPIRDIIKPEKNPPVGISSSVEELIERSTTQNFVPVIDDLNNFIGIVTRSDILKYFYAGSDGVFPEVAFIST